MSFGAEEGRGSAEVQHGTRVRAGEEFEEGDEEKTGVAGLAAQGAGDRYADVAAVHDALPRVHNRLRAQGGHAAHTGPVERLERRGHPAAAGRGLPDDREPHRVRRVRRQALLPEADQLRQRRADMRPRHRVVRQERAHAVAVRGAFDRVPDRARHHVPARPRRGRALHEMRVQPLGAAGGLQQHIGPGGRPVRVVHRVYTTCTYNRGRARSDIFFFSLTFQAFLFRCPRYATLASFKRFFTAICVSQ